MQLLLCVSKSLFSGKTIRRPCRILLDLINFGVNGVKVSSGRAASVFALYSHSCLSSHEHITSLKTSCAKLQTPLRNDVSMLIHSKKHDGGCSSRFTSVASTALTVIIANRRRRDVKARPFYVGAAM